MRILPGRLIAAEGSIGGYSDLVGAGNGMNRAGKFRKRPGYSLGVNNFMGVQPGIQKVHLPGESICGQKSEKKSFAEIKQGAGRQQNRPQFHAISAPDK